MYAPTASHPGGSGQRTHGVSQGCPRCPGILVEALCRHPTKRCRAYLSVEEEKELLDKFVEKSQQGHIPVAEEIQKAFEEKIGHPIHKTTIYRFLQRNDWRKVVPRPVHPKNDPEQMKAFKKNSRCC